MSFKSLGLSKPLLQAIEKKGYDTPSPIQEKAIPLVIQGKDVLASAQTGTGKTAGFTLPILHRLTERKREGKRKIRALVLTPTRELAAQVYDNVREYSEFLDIRSAVIFGGVKQKAQVNTLRQGVDFLVATPGRLLDLHNQKLLSLRDIEVVVLDEADRMLDMGFLRDIQKIMNLMPAHRQNLMFSATFSTEIKVLAKSILNNPVAVETTRQNSTVEAITQKIYRVARPKKTGLIIKLISEGNWKQVLVFMRTKHGANKLCKKMIQANIKAAAIHGNKSQGARTQALAGFKEGNVHVLVATDIAARGLDIPLLPHVVNFELPNISEDYVHRIGRTGRAGAKGEAISLVSADETTYLRDIEKLIKLKLPVTIVEGFEPDPNASTEPLKQGRAQKKGTKPNAPKSRGGNSSGRKPKRAFGKKSGGRGGDGSSGSGDGSGRPKKNNSWKSKKKRSGDGRSRTR